MLSGLPAACLLLCTASHLQDGSPIIHMQVLRSQLKPGTAVSILAAADQFDCSELYQEAVSHQLAVCSSVMGPSLYMLILNCLVAQYDMVRTHFDVISTSPEFAAEVQQLPLRVLLQLLQHTGLQTASEAPVLEVCPRLVLASLSIG